MRYRLDHFPRGNQVATEIRCSILSFSLSRIVGRPQHSTCFFPKVEKKVKVRGLPHLAKNERDMGHPTLCGREKERRGHPSLLRARSFTSLYNLLPNCDKVPWVQPYPRNE